MRAHIAADGSLYGIGERDAPVEIDAITFGPPGTRYVRDPANPRRAIPSAKTDAVATREREDRLIDLEVRRAAAERLGLTEAEARLARAIEIERERKG